MSPLGRKDLELMLTMKKEESSEEDFDGKINMWDFRFEVFHVTVYELQRSESRTSVF